MNRDGNQGTTNQEPIETIGTDKNSNDTFVQETRNRSTKEKIDDKETQPEPKSGTIGKAKTSLDTMPDEGVGTKPEVKPEPKPEVNPEPIVAPKISEKNPKRQRPPKKPKKRINISVRLPSGLRRILHKLRIRNRGLKIALSAILLTLCASLTTLEIVFYDRVNQWARLSLLPQFDFSHFVSFGNNNEGFATFIVSIIISGIFAIFIGVLWAKDEGGGFGSFLGAMMVAFPVGVGFGYFVVRFIIALLGYLLFALLHPIGMGVITIALLIMSIIYFKKVSY